MKYLFPKYSKASMAFLDLNYMYVLTHVTFLKNKTTKSNTQRMNDHYDHQSVRTANFTIPFATSVTVIIFILRTFRLEQHQPNVARLWDG